MQANDEPRQQSVRTGMFDRFCGEVPEHNQLSVTYLRPRKRRKRDTDSAVREFRSFSRRTRGYVPQSRMKALNSESCDPACCSLIG